MNRIAAVLKDAEIMNKGSKEKDGKVKKYFQALLKREGGFSDLVYVNGDGVECGKLYDLNVLISSWNGNLYFKLIDYEELK